MEKEELKEAVKDLAFDIYHFRAYVELYSQERLATHPPLLKQAVIYSLLLHMRVLLNFFQPSQRRDDCCVQDFGILPTVVAALDAGDLSLPTSCSKPCVELNKRLAHFTKTRWRLQAPDMKFYEGYFEELETLLCNFEAALPTDVRKAFTDKLAEWSHTQPANF